MAFEREAIPSSAPAPAMPPVMREDKVVEPYNTSARLSKASAAVAARAIGQADTSSVAEETAKTAESVTLSPQMAALLKKEQAFRQKEQAVKVREADLEKERAEIAELKAMKEALATGDYSKLDGLVPYDKFAEWKINQLNGQDPQQEALKKLEAKLEGIEKSQQDDISKRFDAAVADRRTAVKSLVDTNPEFAPLKKGGEKIQEAVLQHILQTWEHDSQELSPEQAAKEVKEALMAKKAELDALFVESEVAEVEKKSLPPLKPGIKTLTNQMTGSDVKRPVKTFQGMTDEQRWAEARRRAEEKLSHKGR